MLSRKTLPLWIGVTLLSGMFLMGQENWPPTEECFDLDSDGYGDPASTVCDYPGLDCDDSDPDIHPGAAPNDSTTDCMKDWDDDEYGDEDPPSGVTPGSDCNDDNPACATNCTDGCGDSFVCGAEACDDGNMDPCGTCDATCSTVQIPASATGTIKTVPSFYIADSETFAIDDGLNVTVFEFDLDAAIQPGNVAVPMSGLESADDVRDSLIVVINSIGASLQVSAAAGASALASLANDNQGSLGNRPLFETVSDVGFAVNGMAGGLGRDCPAGTGCVSGNDCGTGSCTGGVCD